MDKESKVVEMVLFKLKEGVTNENAKIALTELNKFIAHRPGFISRTTSVSENNEFLDLVYWTDLKSAVSASEMAMKDPLALKSFEVIDEKTMSFEHFLIFNKKQE